MGKIVIHAGEGKAGSSSIQAWLGNHSPRLREEAGIACAQGLVGPSGDIIVRVHDEGPMHANLVDARMSDFPDERPAITEQLLTALDELARNHAVVLISSEGFSAWFFRRDLHILESLEALSSDHEVTVAYYIRPQHSALEAAWKQWWYRFQDAPSAFLERRSQRLEHYQTYRIVNEVAPSISFAQRPFRRDLLHEGNIVADFAKEFLGLPPDESMVVWENKGLPLDMVNALRYAPPGVIWRSGRDTQTIHRLKQFVADIEVPESDRAKLASLVLQQACRDRFEPDNQRLISTLGWQTDHWVPPVDGDIGEASFERMNELWEPHASEAEQLLLQHALAELLRRGLESADR